MLSPNDTSTVTELKPPKMPYVLGRRRIFWTLFVGLLVFNFLIYIFASTSGWNEGFYGAPGFDWGYLTTVLAGMFGDLSSFLVFATGVAIIVALGWGSAKLSKAGYNTAIGILVVIVLVFGLAVASLGWISLAKIDIDFAPFLIFMIGTAIEAAILTVLLAVPFRRKRDTNRKEVRS